MSEYTVCGYDMEVVHERMLEIAVEIDRLCRKHNIKYTIDGGTIIGAVRHNGFVPWDHDFDLAMLRSEYERFIKVCKTELGDKFFFSHYKSEPRHSLNFGKMRMNGTVFLEKEYKDLGLHPGVFCDVHPIDNVFLPLLTLQSRITAYFYCVHKVKNGIYEGSAGKRLLYLPFSWLPFKAINWLRERTMRMFEPFKTKYVYKLAHPSPGRPPYKREMYENLMEHRFEDKMFFMPVDYDEFLTKRYGNYMEYPPEANEKSCCSSVIECKL